MQSRAFLEESGDRQIKKIVILFFESAFALHLGCIPCSILQKLIGEPFLWDQ